MARLRTSAIVLAGVLGLWPNGPAAAHSGAARSDAAHSAAALTERNRRVVVAFAHQFYAQRNVRGAFAAYVAPDYVQHNPGIPDGRDAAVKALEPVFGKPGSRFDIKRIIVDGDLAVIHLHGRSGADGEGGAVADIYRLDHGRIVEHWDVLQPIQSETINPHPYF